MLRITQIKLPVGHEPQALSAEIAKKLRVSESALKSWSVEKRSVDARKKPSLYYVYTVLASLEQEKRILKKSSLSCVSEYNPVVYRFPFRAPDKLTVRPLVVGLGPAGLFYAWMLARNGFRPIVLERGDEVAQRREKVQRFWQDGVLDPESNVQFGEGGAGTFSDGKLYTGVHDPTGRNHEVLQRFVDAGAPESILYDAHAHLGTDQLTGIVRTLRRQITEMGGEVHFRSRMESLLCREQRVTGVRTADGRQFDSTAVVLAIGHSARDTFRMLAESHIPMEPKAFAIGVRVQHEQELITRTQYGEQAPPELGAAAYKLHTKTQKGRAVYTFCMCPGGYILNASSSEEMLAVNGMSNQDRSSGYANSAVVAAVLPEECRDYLKTEESLLAGMYFQELLEKRAWHCADGRIPVQRFSDFSKAGSCLPAHPAGGRFCSKGDWQFADVRSILPSFTAQSIEEGMHRFGKTIPGFDDGNTLLAGVETRTSSPLRILRGERLESSVSGLYPCGEGAGYAGGITSAAIDGIRTAEAVAAALLQA